MMSTIKRAYADPPDGQIHYRYLLGTNPKTSIIFIHTSASSSSCWESLMQLYAPVGYARYAFDVPGFGGSYNPFTAPNIAYYVCTYLR
jgi:pimeloyl-ACP methyl ester carboxylesterase